MTIAMHRGLGHRRGHLVQLRRHRLWLWHQLRGVGRCEAVRGRGRYNGRLRWRAHACTGSRWVKLKYWRICTRAHLLLSQLPVHRLGGPPGNAHLCSNFLPHLILETSVKVSTVLENARRNASHARVADGAGIKTKERMIKMKQSRNLDTYRT